MRPVYDYIIKPCGNRYNNFVKIGDVDLILNTEIYNHQYVNRVGIIHAIPLHNPMNLSVGDKVIVHHNVFRRWHNMKGVEKNSRSFLKEDEYIVSLDQIFMYTQRESWIASPGYSFIKPIKNKDKFSVDPESPLIGVVKYSDGTFLKTQLVGFKPGSKYEFIVDGERLYRVMNKFITIEYEYQGNEEEYNPSWAESSRRVN